MERWLAVASAAVLLGLCGAYPAAAAGAGAPAWKNECKPDEPTASLTPRANRAPWILKYFQLSPDGYSDWIEGRLESRLCQIVVLRRYAQDDGADFADVNLRASEVSRLYQARAGRQQIWMDMASRGVQVSALGALASHGAGRHTQQDWGYVGLGLVVISQINAYQPTKDLFFAGSLGINVLQSRYESIRSARQRLDWLTGAGTPPKGAATSTLKDALAAEQTKCNAMRAAMPAISNWNTSGGDYAVIQPEARRVIGICDSLDVAIQAAKELAESPSIGDAALARLEAQDLVFLDDNMVKRDQDLRATPLQTLTEIVAAPLSAATTVITGEDAKKAIDGIKVQQAFDKLDYVLARIDAPSMNPPPTDPVTLAVGVDPLRKPTAARSAAGANPDELNFDAALATLDNAVAGLNTVMPAIRDMNKQAQAITDFVAANHLTFDYDATSLDITVTVAPPPPSPTLQQSGASTGGTPSSK